MAAAPRNRAEPQDRPQDSTSPATDAIRHKQGSPFSFSRYVCGVNSMFSPFLTTFMHAFMCTLTGRRIQRQIAAWLVQRQTARLLAAVGAFDAVMGIFLSLSLCCSSRRGQRAVIKLCLHPCSLSHQLEGFSSRVPQINRPPPSSHLVQMSVPLRCGTLLTPSGRGRTQRLVV